MCHKSTCSTCQGMTWYGCGSHVPQTLDSVPEADRCVCEPKVEKEGKQYPPMGTIGGMFMGMVGMGGRPKGADESGKNEL